MNEWHFISCETAQWNFCAHAYVSVSPSVSLSLPLSMPLSLPYVTLLQAHLFGINGLLGLLLIEIEQIPYPLLLAIAFAASLAATCFPNRCSLITVVAAVVVVVAEAITATAKRESLPRHFLPPGFQTVV